LFTFTSITGDYIVSAKYYIFIDIVFYTVALNEEAFKAKTDFIVTIIGTYF